MRFDRLERLRTIKSSSPSSQRRGARSGAASQVAGRAAAGRRAEGTEAKSYPANSYTTTLGLGCQVVGAALLLPARPAPTHAAVAINAPPGPRTRVPQCVRTSPRARAHYDLHGDTCYICE